MDLKTMKEKILHQFGKLIVRIYCFFAFKIDVKKTEKLPKGPKIFVANHPSTTDPFLTIILIKDYVSILIKDILFKVPVFGLYLKHAGHIPVSLENKRLAFERSKELLINGKSVVLFIEGDVSPAEGGFLKPRTGAARLALLTGAPIIPIGFELNRQKVKHSFTKVRKMIEQTHWYKHGRYSITFGKPIYFQGNDQDHSFVQKITDLIMREVIRVSLQSKVRLLKVCTQ